MNNALWNLIYLCDVCASSSDPTSYIIHHTSYIIHHTSYTIHHTSYTIHHTLGDVKSERDTMYLKEKFAGVGEKVELKAVCLCGVCVFGWFLRACVCACVCVCLCLCVYGLCDNGVVFNDDVWLWL